MEKVTFQYNETEYSAHLVRSESIRPNYYWLVIENDELQAILGDVAFVKQENELLPVNPPLSDKYRDLFHSMSHAIQKAL